MFFSKFSAKEMAYHITCLLIIMINTLECFHIAAKGIKSLEYAEVKWHRTFIWLLVNSHKIFPILKILNYMTVAQGQPLLFLQSTRESKLHVICGTKKIAIIVIPLLITIGTRLIVQNNISTPEKITLNAYLKWIKFSCKENQTKVLIKHQDA